MSSSESEENAFDQNESDSESENSYLMLNNDSSSESESEEDQQGWGSKKSTFVGQQDIDSEEEELAKEEEKEAKILQKKRAQQISEDDFEDSFLNLQKKNSKGKKKSKATKVEQESDESDEIEVPKDLSTLSKGEKFDIVAQQSPELLELLEDFKIKIKEIRTNLQPVLEKAKEKKLPTSSGISFLEVKYQLLLNYCTNISFYLLLKAKGISVKDHPVIDQLVKLRTIIERIAPIETKLKYQIEKLLKIAAGGKPSEESENALNAHPNLDNFEDSDDSDEDKENALYEAPKIHATSFEKEDRPGKNKNKFKGSEMLMEHLKEEFTDQPLEYKDASDNRSKDIKKKDKEITEYEETAFIRLMQDKKDKKLRTADARRNEFAEIADFSDFAVLDKQRKKEQDFEEERANQSDSSMEDSSSMSEIEEEDDYYKEQQEKQQRLKEKKKENYRKQQLERIAASEETETDGKRPTGYTIDKNVGLKRKRKQPISRVKKRNQFERQTKRRKTVVRDIASQQNAYGGEKSGINQRVKRSINLKED